MELKAYLKLMPDDEVRETFAIRCGTTLGHMRNVSYGSKPCAHKLAALIWEQSGRVVTRESLCPDDYWVVWPELKKPAGTNGAPKPKLAKAA